MFKVELDEHLELCEFGCIPSKVICFLTQIRVWAFNGKLKDCCVDLCDVGWDNHSLGKSYLSQTILVNLLNGQRWWFVIFWQDCDREFVNCWGKNWNLKLARPWRWIIFIQGDPDVVCIRYLSKCSDNNLHFTLIKCDKSVFFIIKNDIDFVILIILNWAEDYRLVFSSLWKCDIQKLCNVLNEVRRSVFCSNFYIEISMKTHRICTSYCLIFHWDLIQ